MTQDEHEVLLVHPTAYDVYDGDEGTYKIYYRSGDARVVLSKKWNTCSMAWADALAGIRARQKSALQALHEGDDGR